MVSKKYRYIIYDVETGENLTFASTLEDAEISQEILTNDMIDMRTRQVAIHDWVEGKDVRGPLYKLVLNKAPKKSTENKEKQKRTNWKARALKAEERNKELEERVQDLATRLVLLTPAEELLKNAEDFEDDQVK